MDVIKLPSNKNNDTSSDSYSEVESKLLLLFLMEKMDIPLSHSQISEFTLRDNYMTYFTLQQILAEMVVAKYIEKSKDNNSTRYTITHEGLTLLEYFDKHIPLETRNQIIKYVSENRKNVKKDFEITSNFFYDHTNNEFIVKCSLYDDDKMLMEINLSVVSREQAKLICSNWKKHISLTYGNILGELASPKTTLSDKK
jgi:hypothetical protein